MAFEHLATRMFVFLIFAGRTRCRHSRPGSPHPFFLRRTAAGSGATAPAHAAPPRAARKPNRVFISALLLGLKLRSDRRFEACTAEPTNLAESSAHGVYAHRFLRSQHHRASCSFVARPFGSAAEPAEKSTAFIYADSLPRALTMSSSHCAWIHRMPKTLPISRKLRRAIEELALALHFFPKASAERGRKHTYLERVRYTRPGVLAGLRDKAQCVVALTTRQLGDGPTPPPAWQLVVPVAPKTEAQNENGGSAQGSSRGNPTDAGPRPRPRRRP